MGKYLDKIRKLERTEPIEMVEPNEALMQQQALDPTAPLHPGWLVAYRDRRGTLCGGCDDRAHGTVQECHWDGNGWTLGLTDGQRVPLSIIRSVGQTDERGKIVEAWTVQEHSVDGQGAS